MGEQRGRKRAGRPPIGRLRETPDPRFSRSLEYGVAALECLTAERTSAGVVDFAAALGVGRSTAHRYAATLHALGYLEQDEHRKYRLGRLALEPGIAAIGAVRASAPDAEPVLAELRDLIGHTVSMGVLDGERVVYVHRLHAHGAGQYEADLRLGVGASLPLHCTARGKALLASLDESERSQLTAALRLTRCGPRSITNLGRLSSELRSIGKRGPAISDEEIAPEVRSIAVAIAGEHGSPKIAIDVTVPAPAYTASQLAEKPALLLCDAAVRIGAARARRR
ncbi:MAG: IclR family transcriptional regulator [Solirubrobacteraceae bacterium]